MTAIAALALTSLLLDRPAATETAHEDAPVLLAEQPPVAGSTLPRPAVGSDVTASGIAPDVEMQILRDAGDPGARLRDVRFADKEQRIACGEIMRSNTTKHVRFVWLGEPAKVIADEKGGGAYAQVAPLCYGQGAAGL
ncbi:hypothetical protein [Sphingopyxis alaskensis]|uniref:hypothetical protein n=1 Tax=Sphingopyxis alaskensis TaxID=117207 RepID=UPI0019AD18CF|nr:hypothetical protein [Sphingopyxis alaskensis]MBD3744948.1 hypothetical protein [Sphingopyxis terrae]MCM3420194.1 hypothetical protein [Sphingopyxis alaskensis]